VSYPTVYDPNTDPDKFTVLELSNVPHGEINNFNKHIAIFTKLTSFEVVGYIESIPSVIGQLTILTNLLLDRHKFTQTSWGIIIKLTKLTNLDLTTTNILADSTVANKIKDALEAFFPEGFEVDIEND
jgi:hypothetical protein